MFGEVAGDPTFYPPDENADVPTLAYGNSFDRLFVAMRGVVIRWIWMMWEDF